MKKLIEEYEEIILYALSAIVFFVLLNIVFNAIFDIVLSNLKYVL